jgi:hypothetical protein
MMLNPRVSIAIRMQIRHLATDRDDGEATGKHMGSQGKAFRRVPVTIPRDLAGGGPGPKKRVRRRRLPLADPDFVRNLRRFLFPSKTVRSSQFF